MVTSNRKSKSFARAGSQRGTTTNSNKARLLPLTRHHPKKTQKDTTVASINVDKMSLKELVDLDHKIQKAIVATKERERAELKHKIAALAEDSGFSMSELFGGRTAVKGKSSGVAKYKNPDNHAETWTGRGRKPNWLVAKLGKGARMADFEI
jgi:DNA-binding protein H-NS